MIDIFQRVFAKKKIEVDRIQDDYHDLLVSLASGHELDLEDVRRLTVDSGKTKEECDQDLALMHQRLEHVAERQKWLKVETTLPGLQSKYDALKAELNAAIARLQPQLISAEWELNAASNAGGQVIRIEDLLNRSCLNRSLLEREQEVGQQRLELSQKRKPLHDDLLLARQHLSYFNARLENFEKRKDSWLPSKDGNQDREMRALQAQRDDAASTVDQLERAVADIDERLLPYNQELADIGREKLQP